MHLIIWIYFNLQNVKSVAKTSRFVCLQYKLKVIVFEFNKRCTQPCLSSTVFFGCADEHFLQKLWHSAWRSLVFISWKRAGKDREDEWHQWLADTSRDVWLRQMSLVTLAGDTESCCSKIQSLIELKLEAPNLSTDHRCHGAREEELFSKSLLHCAHSFPCFYYNVLISSLQIFSTPVYPGAGGEYKRAII